MEVNERLMFQYEGFRNTNDLLIKNVFDDVLAFEFEEPKGLENIPFIPERLVLGKRIERFFSAYIFESDRYELLTENLQIIKEKVTIGELDFIVKDKYRNEIVHIELVYKFYLFQEGTDDISSWIGPNNNDSLEHKLDKLKTKQFPLLRHKETINSLNRLGIPYIDVKQSICFLSNLFLPYNLAQQTIHSVNKDCVVGWWATLQQFETKYYEEYLFSIPDKEDWIVDCKFAMSWVDYDLFLQEVRKAHNKNKSPLCWVNKGSGVYEKFFLVWW